MFLNMITLKGNLFHAKMTTMQKDMNVLLWILEMKLVVYFILSL